MNRPLPTFRSHLTLGFCTLLHAFTHAYASMLVPLYLMMARDLKLKGVSSASFIVTLYGAMYCFGSYFAGELADRFDRRVLLGIGLLGNAAAIVGIGLSRDYWVIVALAVAGGAFGSVFHPAANSLAPAHYPKSPGMAIGILGAGSGMGFFLGPQFSGMRARAATWHFMNVASWQKPCIELGIAGLILGLIFLPLGYDPRKSQAGIVHRPIGQTTRKQIIHVALALMFRDFCATAVISLAAIYLLRVFHDNVQSAGLAVGLMMLPSVLANPIFVYFTGGRRRLPGLAIILITGGCVVVTTPMWSAAMTLPVLCVFQTMQMGSYAVSDAAMLERVDPEIRGRVVGLFLLIAGTFGALGPWVMGAWTDWLGPRATIQSSYYGPFGLLAAFMLIAAASSRFLGRLGEAKTEVSALEEIAPVTLG
jgi:MFS family permease